MVFSSIEFLFGFLPITLALYFAFPWAWAKNVVLLVLSLLFYAWGEPVYVLLMMASIVINWAFARAIGHFKERASLRLSSMGTSESSGFADSRESMGAAGSAESTGTIGSPEPAGSDESGRPAGLAGPSESASPTAPSRPSGDPASFGEDDGFDSMDVTPAEEAYVEGDAEGPSRAPASATVLLVLALVFDLGLLGFFKYAVFVLDQLGRFVDGLPLLEIALPIGISFYTLQAVSYVIDVWRGRVEAQGNILYLGMYIAMFPQLIAGPIVRYTDIEARIRHRRVTVEGFGQGLRLFIVGLAKKVLLANTCGVLADSHLVMEPSAIGFVGCLSAVVAYTFQIYFDFGGYSDMAIGLGRMFGFEYPRNFNYPYISTSITEFWRRWHMTLGSFFRDYLYIPLGGNRVSTPRWMLNLLIVWGLTGLWHGASWNFVIWGLYYGFVLMCEKLFLLRALGHVPRWLRHCYAIFVFLIGWAIFAVSGGLANLGHWIMGLFGAYGLLGTSTFFELLGWSYLSVFIVCAIASTPVVPWARMRLEAWIRRERGGRRRFWREAAPEHDNPIPRCELRLPAAAQGIALRRGPAVAISIAVDLVLLALFVCSVMSVVSTGYNPFIYFQF